MDTDPKIDALFDRADVEQSKRCPSVRSIWTLTDRCDPWGDTMQHALALNRLGWHIGATVDPTFHPGAFPDSLLEMAVGDEWPDAQYAEGFLDEWITVEDVSQAIAILGVLLHALEMAGLRY